MAAFPQPAAAQPTAAQPTAPAIPNDLVSVADAALISGYSAPIIRKWVRDGVIPAYGPKFQGMRVSLSSILAPRPRYTVRATNPFGPTNIPRGRPKRKQPKIDHAEKDRADAHQPQCGCSATPCCKNDTPISSTLLMVVLQTISEGRAR